MGISAIFTLYPLVVIREIRICCKQNARLCPTKESGSEAAGT